MNDVFSKNSTYMNKSLYSSYMLFLKIFLCFASSGIFAINYIISFEMNDISIVLTAILILLLSIYNLIKSLGNWYLTIIFSCISYFNYSILMANYISIYEETFFTSLVNDPVSKIGINILLLFMLVITLTMPNKIKKDTLKINSLINKEKQNNILVIGISFILILILVYGFGRPDVVGERGTPSQLYEYSLIFFIVGFYFSGNSKLNTSLITIILFLFAIQNFIFGGRVTGIQLIICWFLMLHSYKMNIYKLFPWILVLFILMSSIGSFRANFNLSTQSLMIILKDLLIKKFALDTAYSAYYTSLTFLKLEEFDGSIIRLGMFKNFILSMFLGGSRVANSNLASYSRQFYVHYMGGVLPFFFHYYLGWIGVIFSAYIVSKYCKMINKLSLSSSGLIKCISIFLVCHVFRWYLYSPSGLFRGVGLTIIIYYVAYFLDLILKRRLSRIYN